MGNLTDRRGFDPDLAIPPGDTIRETIAALGMTQVKLAKRMSRPLKTINEIIKGKTAITPQTATELERVLGSPARFWLRLEMDYQITLAQLRERKNMEQDLPLLTRFPYLEMSKKGWVKRVRDRVERVSQLRSFFAVTSLKKLDVVEAAAFRKSKKRKASPEALSAWVRQGELVAQDTQTETFSRDGFMKCLFTVRLLNRKPIEDASAETIRLCAKNGVALVFVPHLERTYANGATRWLTPNKALIQLSIKGRYEDIFWFTFFHECGHILKHGKKQQFIDMDGDRPSPEEREADEFAQKILIPAKAYNEFCAERSFVEDRICAFAEKVKVDPGIVVGRLKHDEYVLQWELNDLRRKLEWADKTSSGD